MNGVEKKRLSINTKKTADYSNLSHRNATKSSEQAEKITKRKFHQRNTPTKE